MAVLSTSDRKNLPKADFAIPSKAPGSGSYPINDASHARDALSRVSANGSSAEKAEVRTAVKRKFPGIGEEGVGPHGEASPKAPHSSRSRPPNYGHSGMDDAVSAHADRLHPAPSRSRQ